MTDSIQPTDLNQADYLKLFMQELTYQDPLKPIDNREFMAQMAQFSQLQQTQLINTSLEQLLGMTNANQSLLMLGKQVKIKGSEEWGWVREIQFHENAPIMLKIDLNGARIAKQLTEITDVL
jgi:flagellar basal-body rod modification protein FlgD